MLKALIVTDKYATCDKCGAGAKPPDDPLLKIGHYVEWVIIHKSCFDIIVKGVEEMFVNWRSLQKPSTDSDANLGTRLRDERSGT